MYHIEVGRIKPFPQGERCTLHIMALRMATFEIRLERADFLGHFCPNISTPLPLSSKYPTLFLSSFIKCVYVASYNDERDYAFIRQLFTDYI